jgi:hypothetical protein
MTIVDRNKLKEFFQSGSYLTQKNFELLIDSFVHKNDSGFICEEYGLKLFCQGQNKTLISFFENINDFNQKWSLEKNEKNNNFSLNLLNEKKESILFISQDKKIGINTPDPKSNLDINGSLSSKSRIGSYCCGKVPADGNWYKIIKDLNNCHVFEIVAKTSKTGKGLHSIVHAIALSSFGDSKNKIKKINASYGGFLNKIDFRWQGSTFDYNLQIRSRINYGEDYFINYHVTSLWDESFFEKI